MKGSNILKVTLLIFIFGIIFTSCSANKKAISNNGDEKEENEAYSTSLSQWADFKKKNQNSYEYSVGFASFTGYSNRTTVVVKNGKVISRSFYEFDPTKELENQDVAVYIEQEGDLNTHEKGSPAITIDELYQDCENYLQVNQEENTITFQTDDSGILMSCGYTPMLCADDCFVGISIQEIKPKP